MRAVEESTELVAYCGLYCGACRSYLKEKCRGCRENEKATWCKVRSCCIESGVSTCAECREYPAVQDCPKFNNIISKLFGIVFRSDRAACIGQIKETGIEGHAKRMAALKIQTIRK